MIADPRHRFLIVADYREWEAAQPLKYEYIAGQVYAMTGGTLPHNDIAVNLTTALRTALRGTGCKVRMAAAKVEISEQGPYFYPDIVVSCHPQDRQAIHVIRHPKLILEVLSPSTTGFDYGDKFKFYRRIPTLEEYVLIDSQKVGIDCYRKSMTGRWELTAYPEDCSDSTDPVFELESLQFSCPLSLVYEEVQFPPDQPQDLQPEPRERLGL